VDHRVFNDTVSTATVIYCRIIRMGGRNQWTWKDWNRMGWCIGGNVVLYLADI